MTGGIGPVQGTVSATRGVAIWVLTVSAAFGTTRTALAVLFLFLLLPKSNTL